MLEVQIKRERPGRVGLEVSNGKTYLLTYKTAFITSVEFEISGCNETFYYRRISKWWFKYDYGAFRKQELLFRIYSRMFQRHIAIDGRTYGLRNFLKLHDYHYPRPLLGQGKWARYPESFETEGLVLTGYEVVSRLVESD